MAAKKVMKLMVFKKEIIKPSSPTPSHLQTFKLSCIDKYIPPVRLPLIFFYKGGGESAGRRLKKSLSETLKGFYPVAGRLSTNSYEINCRDEGVPYHQVRANVSMSEALQRPEIVQIDRLIPTAPAMEGLAAAPLLQVQETYFECGGVAIGLSMSHKIGDGSSLSTFAKAWSRACFGNQDFVVPDFTAPSELPAQHPFPLEQSPVSSFEPENYTASRFVIDASKIRNLKAIAASDAVPNPTRTEVVSAFLWKCSMKAAQVGAAKPSFLGWSVNLRSKISPPLAATSMGNLAALLVFQKQQEIRSLATLVCTIRQGINKFILDSKKDQLQGGRKECISALLRSSFNSLSMVQEGNADLNFHSSCCGFPFYDIDFGWGKPAWVNLPYTFSPNTTILIDTPCGGGVEAFANLEKENMDLLEHDPEFLEFASVNPSPLEREQ